MSTVNDTILPPPPVISTYLSTGIWADSQAFGSSAFPSANRAYYTPVTIPYTVVATKLFSINGATASNNLDIGIYDATGTKIVSTGSTAQSGTSQVQLIDITDTTLGPGLFYLALACNGTSATFLSHSSATAALASVAGIYSQNTAFALPATATFATPATVYVPVIGFTVAPTILI